MPESRKCIIWWCNNKHYALGYCKAHWAGLKRYNNPYGKHADQMKRIDAFVNNARLLAIKVINFDNTEVDKDFTTVYTHENSKCSFCSGENGTHDQTCPVLLSRALLDATKRYCK